jgi:hypothetical protein
MRPLVTSMLPYKSSTSRRHHRSEWAVGLLVTFPTATRCSTLAVSGCLASVRGRIRTLANRLETARVMIRAHPYSSPPDRRLP